MWPAYPGSGNRGYTPALDYQIVASFGQIGGTIVAGAEQYIKLYWSGTILGWDILANRVGAIEFDVRLADPSAAWPPVAGASIVHGSPPRITGGRSAASGLITPGLWTQATLHAGSALCVHVTSVTDIVLASLNIWCRR